MKTTRVHLLRHGQVEGYQSKRYNGQGGDTRLTDLGRQHPLPLPAVFSTSLSLLFIPVISADVVSLLIRLRSYRVLSLSIVTN